MITLMLQAMGQADAGRVIIKMEKQISQMEDEAQAAVFEYGGLSLIFHL